MQTNQVIVTEKAGCCLKACFGVLPDAPRWNQAIPTPLMIQNGLTKSALQKELALINAKSRSVGFEYYKHLIKYAAQIVVPIVIMLLGVIMKFGAGDIHPHVSAWFVCGFCILMFGFAWLFMVLNALYFFDGDCRDFDYYWKDIEEYIESRFYRRYNGISVEISWDNDIYGGSHVTYRNIVVKCIVAPKIDIRTTAKAPTPIEESADPEIHDEEGYETNI
eukprot:115604_1